MKTLSFPTPISPPIPPLVFMTSVDVSEETSEEMEISFRDDHPTASDRAYKISKMNDSLISYFYITDLITLINPLINIYKYTWKYCRH